MGAAHPSPRDETVEQYDGPQDEKSLDDQPSVASPVAALSWRLQNQTNESDYRLGNEISKQNEDSKQFIKIAKAD